MPKNVTTVPTHRPLDDETAAALTLYNTYLIADREQRAHERALRKAEKAKDEAAAAVRKLNDSKAPAADTAEAEAKYREAAETLQHLRDGTTAPASGDEDAPDTPVPEADDNVGEAAGEPPSVGVEASVGDEDLAGDEPAGVAG